MNILVCIPCLLTGGTEIQTLSLVKALRSAGHEVKVACYFEWNPEIVTRFEEEGATVYLMSPDGNRPHGLRKISSHLLRGFKKIIKETKPDVAHVQYMTPAALVIGILKLLGIRKIVATSHTDADIYSPNGLRIIRLLSRTCLSAFQCITLRAEESYFGNSRLFDGTLTPHFTIYNCLPEHIEVCRQPRAAITEGKTVTLGVVSRLERIKGMDLVIPAFAQVVATHPNVRLLVVGDGALKPFMERQAADFGLKDEIEFVGRQPQSE